MIITIDVPESRFQQQVLQVAEDAGWDWMHIGRVGKHVANGAKGTLGRGWPDLTLVRDKRLLFVELKAENEPPPTVIQQLVIARLARTGAETYVWRPSQWGLILEVLA